MAYKWDHPSYIREDKTRGKTKLNMTPELMHSMSKKIAQLTKVIYNLNMRIEDKDLLIMTMKTTHEEEIQKVLSDSREKVAQCKEKMCQETELKEKVKNLEDQLSETKLLLDKLSIVDCYEKRKMEQPNKLSVLTEKLETTKCDLQNILKEFEMLHKNLRSNLRIKSSCIKLKNCTDTHDKQTIPNGNVQFLKNLCDTLEKENTLLVQKYDSVLNAIKTQYDEILLEVQKLKLQPVNSIGNCQCNGTNFIKDLSNHETFFKKRLNELLLQLSDSEEQSERHQREINHLKEIIQNKVKETNSIKEELQKLKNSNNQDDNLKEKDIPILHNEDKKTNNDKENEVPKNLEQKNVGTNTDLQTENTETELEFVQDNYNTQNIPSPVDLNQENFNKTQEEIINFAKNDFSKVTKEWKKKHKEAIKNYQTEMKKQTTYLNKLWRERLISKEKELKEQSKQEINAAVNEIIIQKSIEYENAQKDWQNTVNHLLKQISQLEESKQLPKEYKFEKKTEHKDDAKNENTFSSQEINFQEKLKLAMQKQDMIYKEKLEEIKKQHLAELNEKEEAHKFILEKMKLEKECKLNEERQKLQQMYQAHNSILHEKFKSQKSKALEEQEKILLGEIKIMQTQLDTALEEIHLKDENAFQKERQLKKELALQKNEESKLHATIKILQSELTAVTEELELKRNEILCVRNEATHQIRNLENYWQTRLCKELKKLNQVHREEKQNMLNNFVKAQDLLKDKIFLLKTRLQSSDNMKNPKIRAENFENAKLWKKNLAEKKISDFKLKEDKRTMSLELLNQERNKATILDSTALLGIQKTVYERTILKPLSSPFLQRRNSGADTNNQKQNKTHNNTSGNKRGLRILDKRASWSGENIQRDVIDKLYNMPSNYKEFYKNEEKASSCIDLSSVCSNEPFSKSVSMMQCKPHPLSKHPCDTIMECEEPKSLLENENNFSNSNLQLFQNDVASYHKSEFCHKLPLLESEL